MTLNLTAKSRAQELILAYLQENASEILAEKINNGTPITKDCKQLVNKKTLDGFMAFANSEARKLVEKGANSACVEDSVVYGWAIHYFEEDSIEGTLYHLDGMEYKPPKPVVKTATPKMPVKVEPKQQQGSLFDMLSAPTSTIAERADDQEPVENTDEDDEEPTEEELAEAMEEQEQITPTPLPPVQHRPSEWYQHYLSVKEKYKDCILLYRFGDFYEMFGDDARTCADILNLTLTGRDCGLAERVLMSGIPFHATDVYIAKLINGGYKVAVAERLDGTVQGKVYEPQNDDLQVDEETGEVLSAEEMRKFDGDIEEPKTPVMQNDKLDDEDELPDFGPKAFDPEALCVLDELFGKTMILR